MTSSAKLTTWFVTGTSRGIGLEIVRQLLESPNNLVVAGCRTPERATALHALEGTAKGTLHVIQLDVSDVDSIRASAKELERILGSTGLDYLINNAGIAPRDDAFTVDPDTLLTAFRTNTLGPTILSQVALPFLERGRTKKILHISSSAGSHGSPYGEVLRGNLTAYSISKAGLNMLATRQRLARPEFIIIVLCPGPVKTDLSGEYGQLEPHESVAGVLKVIISATAEDSGKFYSYDGTTIPW
ncbi:NAD-P-binding protein [Trametes polyzona]|nr:NAD-P-binding protein [Trametes polyzona]